MKRFLVISLLMMNWIVSASDRVVQTQLDNGLTVLVCPVKDAATVSIQLWYNVGSNDEVEGERGIAHFIEHMIFKGTEIISESDIDLVTNKLSGNCNAFTWYDYTGYLFNLPSANWDKVLPMMADCMQNCTFKQDHLNSELKAVIQEMKMIKDQFARNLREVIITNIFESHPYHYSAIGFKQNLWTVSRETLLKFYKKYYTPDNAVMVIVGNVDPADAHQKIDDAFGSIPAGNGWHQRSFFFNEDVKTKTINMYRDVQQSISTIAYVVPGVIALQSFELEALTHVLANGRGSRLYKLLVDELQLVVDVHAIVYDMFEKGMLFVEFYPCDEKDIHIITELIQKEIDDIAQNGPTLQEVTRAHRFAQLGFQELLENTQEQANIIGTYFTAVQNPQIPFNFGKISPEDLAIKIQEIAATYCSCVQRNQGNVLAIPQSQIGALQKLQQISDEEDTLFLNAKQRESAVEGGSYVHSVKVGHKQPSIYSKPGSVMLDNGLELLWLHSDTVDIVECALEMKVTSFYDDEDKQGLGSIVSEMLLEGTKNYPGQKFSDKVESYGIALSVHPGFVSATCLKQDTETTLSLISEMLMNASLEQESLDKIKEQALLQLKSFWDTPTQFRQQLAHEIVYKNHPYHKNPFGTQDGIAAITLDDCVNYYKNMMSPQGARLAIVGNLADQDVQDLVEKTVGQWQGQVVADLEFPVLQPVEKQEILSNINRDQIALGFVGLSVDRFHEDYDKIALFDQIFGGGGNLSMSSRLFQLRQRSGLFYTVGCSLLQGAGKQPGMISIRTIVSPDRLAEAEKAFLQVIDEAINDLPEEELQEAKRVLVNSFDKLYETNGSKAATFLFLSKYDLPFDYFEKRAESLQDITVKQVQRAVRKILSSDKIAVIKIGRV